VKKDWGASSDPFKHLDQYLQLLSSDRNRLEPIAVVSHSHRQVQDRVKKDWGASSDPFKHLDQYLQLLSSDRNRLVVRT
jgi:hypothetical protein